MNNNDFSDMIQSVYGCRDKWIGLIESRLHDLTGLKLTFNQVYPYPYTSNNVDSAAINTGKKTVVTFETDKIAECLGTDDLFEVWRFILGHINTGEVFTAPEPYYDKELNDEAKQQLERILDEIRRQDECEIMDVLGIFSSSKHTIKIFAQVIAYYSIRLGVSAEDLAFVVLTHELAHAYTIAGYDINGSRGTMMDNPYGWDTDVIEGLAQYYTDAICHQLQARNPEFKAAFEKLRDKQMPPYTWYQNWFNHNQDHERVRSIMLDYRNTCNSAEFIRQVQP